MQIQFKFKFLFEEEKKRLFTLKRCKLVISLQIN
jgi:hypothetical protein